MSVWVNALWFSSLVSSMMGALGIMVAKTISARWSREPGDVEKILNVERQRGLLHDNDVWILVMGYHGDMFRPIFKLQIAFISFLIYVAFGLFFSGLVVLLLNDQRRIGTAILVLTIVFGTCCFFAIVLYSVRIVVRRKWRLGSFLCV